MHFFVRKNRVRFGVSLAGSYEAGRWEKLHESLVELWGALWQLGAGVSIFFLISRFFWFVSQIRAAKRLGLSRNGLNAVLLVASRSCEDFLSSIFANAPQKQAVRRF